MIPFYPPAPADDCDARHRAPFLFDFFYGKGQIGAMSRDLTDAELERYARHAILDEIGEAGQVALLDASVLVVGAGGLGSPALLYLAAAGVGRLGVVDADAVDATNLQRQILHGSADLGRAKADSAAARLAALNPDIRIDAHRARLGPDNALDLIAGYDLVLDGSDNAETRYLVNDACYFLKVPLVSASVVRFDGQLATFKPFADPGVLPCYRCIYPTPTDPGLVPRCDSAGILGPAAGVMGTLQATEAIKQLLGLGEGLAGRLMLYCALDAEPTRLVRVKADPDCALCGAAPTITAPGRASHGRSRSSGR